MTGYLKPISLEKNPKLCIFSYRSTMKPFSSALICIFVLQFLAQIAGANDVPFYDNYFVNWAPDHVYSQDGGWTTFVKLDNDSGAGFQSQNSYKFGYFSMKLKLVPGYSAGVVSTFYLTSLSDHHDEIDFEFLGNVTGQPWILHTNIFTNGTGGKEQRFYLWFDPTADYHRYAILWNLGQVVWFVDDYPIRVYRNTGVASATFPTNQPMWVRSSLWNGDQWATRGGLDKIDWSYAPFISSYQGFGIEGCQWSDPYPPCVSTLSSTWWGNPSNYVLSSEQQQKYSSVRWTYNIYDYCHDIARYPVTPPECYISPW